MTGVSAEDVAVLELHAEWRSADIADPCEWTVQLTVQHLVELGDALRVARETHADLLDVEAVDFPLDSLGSELSRIESQLMNGRGFARITGLPVQDIGTEDACWMYWGIGRHLGDPWPQNARGHVLGDVRGTGKSMDDPTTRGYELSGERLTFHTDGSDLVGLLCLNPGVSGGESLIANAVGAHNELVRTQPRLAAALYDPLPYDYRGEEAPGKRPYYSLPVFSRHGHRLFVRYIRPFIESSQRHEDAPRITPQQAEAMDAFDSLIADPTFQAEMTFAPGDMQFINNYHVLHGRRRYVDDFDSGQVRHLKRLWLATNVLGDADRPAPFKRNSSTSHWNKNRSKA